MQSDQEEEYTTGGRESPASSVHRSEPDGSPENGPMSPDEEPSSPGNYEPSSPITGPESPDNEPASPDQEPMSPEQEPLSPSSLGPKSPNNDDEIESVGPASPVGSVDEDEPDDRNQSDQEVVREDVDSGDEERGSANEDDDKRSEADSNNDEIERASVASEGPGSVHSNRDDDDASVHSEIEERASIHSDDENEKSGDEETKKNSETGETSQPSRSEDKNEKDSNSDDDDSDDDSKVGELIADIFGESDDDGEFEGFGEEDLADAQKKKEKKKSRVLSDSEGEEEKEQGDGEAVAEEPELQAPVEDEEEGETPEKPSPQIIKKKSKDSDSDSDDDGDNRSHIVYDFDLMMQKKKDEAGKRRRKRGYEIINDSDDLIADILAQMKQAADDDRNLNKSRMAATKKLKLLPMVGSQLKKSDLKEAFLDQGVLSVMTDWLTPLPDRSLPHLQIRETMLRLLGEFPPVDQSLLKNSGIGRAIMYLYKHPKETRENREKAGRLINEWSRPIFNLNTNFRSMTKEERERRDFDHMPKKRKERLEAGDETGNDINSALAGDDRALRPGEKGWIGRARVPMPSTKDYVVRPKWNIETEFSKSSRKQLSRLDKHVRNFMEKKKRAKAERAVTISVEGRKMSL